MKIIKHEKLHVFSYVIIVKSIKAMLTSKVEIHVTRGKSNFYLECTFYHRKVRYILFRGILIRGSLSLKRFDVTTSQREVNHYLIPDDHLSRDNLNIYRRNDF